MEVRIKFSADLIIVGKDIKDVRNKWENLPLFSKEAKECGAEYIETLLIEDGYTHDDLTEVYNHAYGTPKEESKPKFHGFYHFWIWVFCTIVIIIDFIALVITLISSCTWSPKPYLGISLPIV